MVRLSRDALYLGAKFEQTASSPHLDGPEAPILPPITLQMPQLSLVKVVLVPDQYE